MFRRTPPTDGSAAGFTILEVLIALAIVAVSIVAIGSVMSTNVRGVRSLEQHVTMMQAVRTITATEVPSREKIGFGTWSGRTNDHQWRIDVTPMGEEWAATGSDVPWIPALVKIQVRSPSGAVTDLKTVRLVHGQQQ
ncbi:PulJ/GspJ family protein [Bradyrhizobium erythrophlei]|uniref:General secretion pathway protein I n=1 Tax=Bradyrhizobium erythrophlei TaxID=1437360 RepID=A0A1M7T2G5_9BRAD|nr:prepilin-type N-terminal cleavage/methylation domain-containing protein [Bradyrhizobium erythrophlei]SHN64901.1 general secretion pathway protein I [Bradyrhizobium erythrophlei]